MTADTRPPDPTETAHEAADPATPPDRLEALALDPQLEPVVAANPSTGASTLAWLGHVQNPATRAAVAGNPNTPLEALLQVAAEFPQEFLDNPVLPLLLLERPSLAVELPLETVQGLMRCEQVPAALLGPLVNRGQLRAQELARMHVSVAGEPATGDYKLPDRALHDTLWPVVRDAHSMFALPGLFSPWLLELIADHVYAEDIAISPDAAPELLERLAASESTEIAVRAGRNPLTPVEALVRLSTKGNTQISVAVTENPGTPEWLLDELAADPVSQVRVGVALNPRTPASTLRSLGSDPDTNVREWVALHPRTDTHMIEQLARDEKVSVRAGAARSRTIPPRCLEALATDTEPEVRAAAARNLRLSDSVVEQLLHDDDPSVRRAAAQRARPEALEPLLDGISEDAALLEGAAANHRLPGARVARFGQSNSLQVLRRVAQHPHAPADLLERLAGHLDPVVRMAVARNSRTPLATLQRLAPDSTPFPQRVLIYNPCTPLDVLEQLLEKADPLELHTIVHHQNVSHVPRRELYARLCDRMERRYPGQVTLVRLALLSGDLLSSDGYWGGARSVHWIERYVLACNPSAPLDVLEALAHDGIVYVRAGARDTLAARTAVKDVT